MDELAIFEEFVNHHIAQDPDRDVQRMLLWAEWVRFYMRRSRRFPGSVLESKFDELIVSHFGVGIGFDTFRGPVYVGIRYIPQQDTRVKR